MTKSSKNPKEGRENKKRDFVYIMLKRFLVPVQFCYCFRPAGVCSYSMTTNLFVSKNYLTNDNCWTLRELHGQKRTVLGGSRRVRNRVDCKPPRNGFPYEKVGDILIVSLTGVNQGFWSYLWCSWRNATIFSVQLLFRVHSKKI